MTESLNTAQEISIQQYALNDLSNKIIGGAINVHKVPGPGLLESAYKECLYFELTLKGFIVEIEKALPLVYQTVKLDCGYRADLVVDQKIIIEIKSVDALNDLHTAQVLTYLKMSSCKLGLLINFNVLLLKDGINRFVNKF